MFESLDLQSITNRVLRKFDENLDHESNISIYFETNLNQEDCFSTEYHLYPEDLVYYPASLIKLFNAYFAKLKIQSKLPEMVKSSALGEDSFGSRNLFDDIYDAIDASLRFSDNDALGLLVDFNTDTNSGLRLSQEDFEAFENARNILTKIFKQKSYSKYLNVANKCFSFGPYGRDHQLVYDSNSVGRNSLTIEDVVHIMKDITLDYPELLVCMKRDVQNTLDEQTNFIARGLRDSHLEIRNFYSKAGWTSKVRHDAALIELKNETKVLIVIMTKGLSHNTELIPSISSEIFASI